MITEVVVVVVVVPGAVAHQVGVVVNSTDIAAHYREFPSLQFRLVIKGISSVIPRSALVKVGVPTRARQS